MKQALLFLFFFCALHAAAQERKYYDWEWKPCDPSRARFVSLTEKTDSGWLRKDFYLSNKQLQMKGLYADSACTIPDGWFRYYYANGNWSAAGRYVNDKKEGLWLSYHINGMMSDSVFYESGKPLYRMGWHKNGYASDSSVYDAAGAGVHIYWYDNGVPSAAGRTYKGKLNGRWQYFHKNGKPASVEDYDNEKQLNRTYYNEEGVPLTDTTSHDRPATFKGGNTKWKSFLESRLEFPQGVRLVNTDMITVVIEATIDEEGNVTDVMVTVPFNPLFDDEAVKLMQRSPKWMPAISHNRRVKHIIRQVIFFGQQPE